MDIRCSLSSEAFKHEHSLAQSLSNVELYEYGDPRICIRLCRQICVSTRKSCGGGKCVSSMARIQSNHSSRMIQIGWIVLLSLFCQNRN